MAEPFYLFTCRHSGNYYVQFRLEDGTITAPKSTGTPNKKEAQLTAMRWLSSGEIPERVNFKDKSSKTKSLDLLEWMNYLKTYEFEHDDIQKIVDILVKRKMLVSGIVTALKESRPVVLYLLEFWNYDVSPTAKNGPRLVKNCPIHILKQLLEESKNTGLHVLKADTLGILLLMILQQSIQILPLKDLQVRL